MVPWNPHTNAQCGGWGLTAPVLGRWRLGVEPAGWLVTLAKLVGSRPVTDAISMEIDSVLSSGFHMCATACGCMRHKISM